MAADSEQVDEIEDLMEEMQEVRKTAKRKSLIFTVGVLVMVLVMGYIAMGRIRHNFSPEVAQAQFAKKIAEMGPSLRFYTQQVLDGVPEVYRDTFVGEMRNKMPHFQAKLLGELPAFKQDLSNALQKSLQEKMDSAFIDKQEQKLFRINAKVMDPDRIEKDKNYFATELHGMLDDLTRHLVDRFQEDMADLTMTLKGFPRDDEASIDEAQAKKMFVHFWLQLADKELMNSKGGLIQ